MRVERTNGDSAHNTYEHEFTAYQGVADYLAANGGGTIEVLPLSNEDTDCQWLLVVYPVGLYVIEAKENTDEQRKH